MGGRHFLCCILSLLSFQYGMSYRIYILPQEGDFCLGDFSGDTCISWSEYSARPLFVDHSTTLIFTPGNYTYSRYGSVFRVANIKRLTVIGDGARLQFQLSFSNIGYVSMHNLTLVTNYPKVDVRDVQSFLMENCTLIRTQSSSSSSSLSYSLNLYLSNFNRIVGSTFVQAPINAQSYSTLMVTGCSFSNSTTSCINGDSSSNITIHNSSFTNNYITNRYGVVTARSSLFVDGCLFERNSATGGGTAGAYSTSDLSVMNTIFTNNNAIFIYGYYSRSVTYRYSRGGYAISGQQSIYIDNCTFSYYTGSRSSIYSSQSGSYYWWYEVDVRNSRFYHSNRSVYSNKHVMITNSNFYNISTHGSVGGGAVYSTQSITTMNCTFNNITISTTSYGKGGVLYALQSITVHNSSFISSAIVSSSTYSNYVQGGTLWSQGNTVVTNSIINDSQAVGDGGAIYASYKVTLTNTIIENSISLSGWGGAVYGLDVRVTNCSLQNIWAYGAEEQCMADRM